MRRVTVVASLTAGLLVVAAGGYAVADVLDEVPGVLTRAEPTPSGLATFPSPAAMPVPSVAPAPDRAALESNLAPLLEDPALGPDVGVVVRDLASDQVLWASGDTEPRVLASVQKLLAAPALAKTLPLDEPMRTKVVSGAAAGEVVLVAGGDTLLARGAGDPSAVVGHAGLGDLAAQVADKAPPGDLTLRLDTSYAAGPRSLPTWDPDDVTGGFTRGVAQIGLADLRPIDGRVPRVESDADAVTALADALRDKGRTVIVPTGSDLVTTTPAAADAPVLGSVESARYLDVIVHALAESDNALTENLLRQAMHRVGTDITREGATGEVIVGALTDLGLDVGQVTLTDASGLSPGQSAPLTVVDALLATAAQRGGGLDRIVARLPIAGVSGTLHERFAAEGATGAVGIPRLKTGTLTGVSGVAGTTVTADGALLSVVVVASKVPGGFPGTKAARAALDRFVAALTACGCR